MELSNAFSIEAMWKETGFKPNDRQEEAIRYLSGPLYLTAGPGSGKTRVLLWRTLNLIVFTGVHPNEIFLSTFTEKAAFQLREGLRFLLGIASNYTNEPYDISQMYVGTVHSLCQRLILDRRFSRGRQRPHLPHLLDSLDQFFHVHNNRNWTTYTEATGYVQDINSAINALFDTRSASKHVAVRNSIGLFNRLSEERIDPVHWMGQVADVNLQILLNMYDRYKTSLNTDRRITMTDFALLQSHAFEVIEEAIDSEKVFKHIIIDEYQDTNTIQEQLFFKLAAGHKNICVVGDDDQALYRFRGATVENFVEFPERCQRFLSIPPHKIPLSINYRSRKNIVGFYTDFIERCDWGKPNDDGFYRVTDKAIRANNQDDQIAVIASTATSTSNVCAEIAAFTRRLIDEKKVQDPNQIAFLFPSLKAVAVTEMIAALEQEELLVYAPRVGRFLEVPEARAMFGIFTQVFGKPARGNFRGRDYDDFHNWLEDVERTGQQLIQDDPQLAVYVRDRRAELDEIHQDYKALLKVINANRWNVTAPYEISMKRALVNASGLSERAKKALLSRGFEQLVIQKQKEGTPFNLEYIVTRTTSLDWNVLDLFYRICGFDHFKQMFDLAERGVDEGPVCNLGLITQYLARFMDQYIKAITARTMQDDLFARLFFMSYMYALFRLGEAEYEDANDPFPKGRIPFLTIHQAKGLEFPVVVLGNPRKNDRGPQIVEQLVNPLVSQKREPLDRIAEFDMMRMFYVALSRAKNLLVLAHHKAQGQYVTEPFKSMLDKNFPRIPNFDLSTLPAADGADDVLPQNYSFTADYLLYRKCPRQYMIFRKYGFVPSQTRTQFFGSLVHRTLEDLHQYLIAKREATS